jgi:alkylated DNA repair dioxygenase AlkB
MDSIKGLTIISNFVNEYQHDWLIEKIYSLPWSNELKRRTQHYGWKYRYDRRPMTEKDYLGDLPIWLTRFSKHLDTWLLPNQVIINDYQPKQGIGEHIDHTFNFTETIVSLSLMSPGLMVFRQAEEVITKELNPRDLLILTGDARYKWSHQLKPVTQRRVSITFRRIRTKADSVPFK